MQSIKILVSESRGIAREGYVIEQGIPVHPMDPDEVTRLAVFDESGNQVPANVQVEGADQNSKVRWVLVSLPVDVDAGGERRFTLKEAESESVGERLYINSDSEGQITVRNSQFTIQFTNPGDIHITTERGTVMDGPIDFDIRSDARSSVGNQRPVCYEPEGFAVLEQTDKRIRVLLKGRYKAWAPKQFFFDPVQRYDADVEFTIYADSPVIRYKWCITNHMKFNHPYMWLKRYVLSFPLAQGSSVIEGDEVPEQDKFGMWVKTQTSGGTLAMTFPFYDWLGEGAGIEVRDDRIGQGGINPPPDGGFGGQVPQIWRKFFYGMSRTFEGSLLVNPSNNQVLSECNHIPLILSPEHYSQTGNLPENGGSVTFGTWKETVDRAAKYLLDTQWKGTLWHGEWWRERDIDEDLGIEETNSGNSALTPLYHFFRTGDWRFWESAKMSFYYTYDIQFCKREDGWGPYMHTRRFLLDHQEWFHPRYQRVGGIIKPSHVFGDARSREKVMWFLRFWAENYVAEDGSIISMHGDGKEAPTADQKSKCTESAMTNFTDSLVYAYVETGEEFFLNKARQIGDWIVKGVEADLDGFASSSHSARYIQQGLHSLCRVTDDRSYRDAFVKIAEWMVNAPTFDYGTHYVAFHFIFACEAFKMSGNRKILDGIVRLAEWVLSKESKELPGTYPFIQKNQYPPANWICVYDNQAIVSYLPVLASTLADAGVNS